MKQDKTLHRNKCTDILIDIYSDVTLGPLLGFKGGTAAYLLYGLERFSVDLDFDVLDPTQEDFILEKVSSIAARHGIVKESVKKHFNLFVLVSYARNAWNI